MNIRPIETQYKGYRFRSRLEARWAVFFDAMGIEYEYEPEGYDIGGLYYLPDFWLPQVNMFAEVKPAALTPKEYQKAARLCVATHHPVLMLIGAPDFVNYNAVESDTWGSDGDTIQYDYTLITKMISNGEKRFPCANFLPSGYPECYPPYYAAAIAASRSARFEHGQSGALSGVCAL